MIPIEHALLTPPAASGNEPSPRTDNAALRGRSRNLLGLGPAPRAAEAVVTTPGAAGAAPGDESEARMARLPNAVRWVVAARGPPLDAAKALATSVEGHRLSDDAIAIHRHSIAAAIGVGPRGASEISVCCSVPV